MKVSDLSSTLTAFQFFLACLLHFGCRGGVFVFPYIRLCVTGFVFLFVTLFVCLLFARRSGWHCLNRPRYRSPTAFLAGTAPKSKNQVVLFCVKSWKVDDHLFLFISSVCFATMNILGCSVQSCKRGFTRNYDERTLYMIFPSASSSSSSSSLQWFSSIGIGGKQNWHLQVGNLRNIRGNLRICAAGNLKREKMVLHLLRWSRGYFEN